MKKLLILLCILTSNAFADELIIGNNALINGELNGNANGWNISGMAGGSDSNGGPGYTFSFQSGTIAQTYAINQALQGTGIQIYGFNYGFEYRFNCGQMVGTFCEANSIQDTLNTTITITNSFGDTIYSRRYGLGSRNAESENGAYNPNWQSLDTQQRFESPYELANMGNFTMSITGMDNGNWAGNYGPNVRNAYSRPVYYQDQCAINPLSSTSCAGYESAYLTQQCTANPLYSSSCPGYAVALTTQQCTSNPLSSTTCPSYAEEYAKQNILSKETTTTQSNQQSDASSSSSTKVVTTNATAEPVAPVKLNSATVNLGSDNAKITQDDKGKKLNNETPTEPKTNREALAEKRQAEAKKEVATKGKEVAVSNNVGKAKDINTQIQMQNLVIQAMGHSPAFDIYAKAKLPDTEFYVSREVYAGQKNIDSYSSRRLLSGSDYSHQQMIDQQYKLGN